MTTVRKYRWKDPETGDLLSGGGILFYSENSIWVIEEYGKPSEYSDIGGKYNSDDGDIFATIRRELYEETYGMFDILVSQVREFARDYTVVWIPRDGKRTYLCICVPISAICHATRIAEADIPDIFSKRRARVISENRKAWYKPMEIKKIAFADMADYRLSNRVLEIIKQINFF